MNAIDMLRDDHEMVNDLFDKLEALENPAQRLELFNRIKTELEMHTFLEENFIYPMFAEDDEFEDIISDSYDDHQHMKSLLQEIEDDLQSAVEDESLLEELIESVQAHVEEEEEELFPRIEQHMSQRQLDELGLRLQEAREKQQAA